MKTKLPGQWTRCPICDEWYELYGERHKVHEHPEPQSGEPRDQWLASRLPYERWILETTAGKAWVEWRKARGLKP